MAEPTPPAYAAVAADLERRIRDGEFAAGTLLPGERPLADTYGTTRQTVRSAARSLARRGLVASRPGRGWLVQAGQQAQTVGRVLMFSQWAAANGFRFGGEFVARDDATATAHEARALGVGLGEHVLRSVRLRTIDDHPVMIERSTWAPPVIEIVASLPPDVPSLGEALASAGIPLVLGEHRIGAAAASSSDARLLGVRRSSPLLQVSFESRALDGAVMEMEVARYVADFVCFVIRAQDVARAAVAWPRQPMTQRR